LVGYSPKATNYYRQHNENTSVKAQSTEIYYREHEVVGRKLATLYPLSSAELSLQERILYNHWCLRQGDAKREEFLKLYSLERIKFSQRPDRRKRNIAIAVYALTAGGGETFPLFLANHLWQRGYAVTVINFQEQTTEDGVRRMLIPTIPLIDLPRSEWTGMILEDLGIELVHSHHAWVDVNLATYLAAFPTIRHIVTMHGMYEMMERNQIDELLPSLERIDAFVYTTAKNLSNFPVDLRQRKTFVKIDNALPSSPAGKLFRADLGLADDDFVLCMVARAIPEKGWNEAIASVVLANTYSNRKIQLLLIGSGPESERLESLCQPNFVHFLGFRSNVRDYFALADAGFLPTRFKGESAPLVLIDCLLSGRPMLASSVGEIPCMLDSGNGIAGMVFELADWTINVERLGKLIADLANDTDKYSELLGRVPSAAAKFDIDTMADKYVNLYNTVIHNAVRDLSKNVVAGEVIKLEDDHCSCEDSIIRKIT
jgi:glycosyltransferase involved in cell wall biosynthesis